MANRQLLMLAKKFDPKIDIGGWFLSEKLDGHRCFWDGGISRGSIVRTIPWANLGNPHRVVGTATGLWTRYGNVVCAPSWFLDQFPMGTCLDGELWLAPGCRQETKSIVSRLQPDARWKAIKFCVFESPSLEEWLGSGRINGTNFTKYIDRDECRDFVLNTGHTWTDDSRSFDMKYRELLELGSGPPIEIVKQTCIPYKNSLDFVHDCMDKIMLRDGEGVVLRNPSSFWIPTRTNYLMKVKPYYDSEATVIGYTSGLGRLRGMLGALVVSTLGDPEIGLKPGVVFELAGLTDAERQLNMNMDMSVSVPGGQRIPSELIEGSEPLVRVPAYPIGSRVTFRYAGLTKDGVPSEARRLR